MGKGDCSDLSQLWVSIKSQCACQQFLHRSSTASTSLGIRKENHLPISNFDLSLFLIQILGPPCCVPKEPVSFNFNPFVLDFFSNFSNFFSYALCVFWSLYTLYTSSTRWRGFFSLKYEGFLCQHPCV